MQQVEKVTRMIGGGIVVEFFKKGSVFFPIDFISGIEMNKNRYCNWLDVSQDIFGEMSESDIKNVARQINEQICRVGSLCGGVTYSHISIIPRKGDGIIAEKFIEILNARLVIKGGAKHLQGIVDGKKCSVGAGTRLMVIGTFL